MKKGLTEKQIAIIKKDAHNTLFKHTDGRFYIVASGMELSPDNAWCDCKTLTQAEKYYNNY